MIQNNDDDDTAFWIHRGPAYAVVEGRKPGIYSTWAECQANTSGVSGAVHRRFPNALEALDWLVECANKEKRIPGAPHLHIGRVEDCTVAWHPAHPTATQVRREKEGHASPEMGLLRALQMTAGHPVNLHYNHLPCVQAFNYYLTGWVREGRASPIWQEIHRVASEREHPLALLYGIDDYALFLAEFYARSKGR